MDEIGTLRWLCGNGAPPSRLLQTALGAAREQIRDHRIENWIFHKLTEADTSVSSATIEAFRNSRQFFQTNAQGRMSVLSEVLHVKPDLGIVVIKSFSTFAVTEAPIFLHYSSDIDLLCDRPHDLAVTLAHLGFVPDKTPSPHEFANFRRDDIPVEIHRHFPCWALPAEPSSDNFWPADHPGVWQQSGAMMRHEVLYKDIVDHCVPFGLPEGGKVLIPSVTLALVFSCAHAFRDYLSLASVYGRCKPRVRIGDLAEICALAQHPRFDPALFGQLVERHWAEDSVEWAHRVLLFGLSESPLPVRQSPSRTGRDSGLAARFPRHIWGDFLAHINLPPETIFSRGLPLETVIEQLGANPVVLDGGVYAISDDPARRPLPRLLVKRIDVLRFDAECAFAQRGGVLQIEIAVRRTPSGRADRLRLDLGSYALEWDCAIGTRAVATREHLPCGTNLTGPTADRTQVSMEDEASGYRLILRLHSRAIPGLSPFGEGMVLMLGLGILGASAELEAAVMIPIRLQGP